MKTCCGQCIIVYLFCSLCFQKYGLVDFEIFHYSCTSIPVWGKPITFKLQGHSQPRQSWFPFAHFPCGHLRQRPFDLWPFGISGHFGLCLFWPYPLQWKCGILLRWPEMSCADKDCVSSKCYCLTNHLQCTKVCPCVGDSRKNIAIVADLDSDNDLSFWC